VTGPTFPCVATANDIYARIGQGPFVDGSIAIVVNAVANLGARAANVPTLPALSSSTYQDPSVARVGQLVEANPVVSTAGTGWCSPRKIAECALGTREVPAANLIGRGRIGQRRFIDGTVAVIVNPIADLNGGLYAALANECTGHTSHYAGRAGGLSCAAGYASAHRLFVNFSVTVIVDSVTDLWRGSDKSRALAARLVPPVALALGEGVVEYQIAWRAHRGTSSSRNIVNLPVTVVVNSVAGLNAWRCG
jgi:hypothetical protein